MIPPLPPTGHHPPAARTLKPTGVDAAQGRFEAASDRDEEDNDGNNLRADLPAFAQVVHEDQLNEEPEHCGDPLRPNVDDQILRIGFVNCNGIPPHNTHEKNSTMYTALAEHSFDVIGMSEVNLCWHNIASTQRWKHRTLHWRPKNMICDINLDLRFFVSF